VGEACRERQVMHRDGDYNPILSCGFANDLKND
jgi:hypothetical protein